MMFFKYGFKQSRQHRMDSESNCFLFEQTRITFGQSLNQF